MEPVEIREIQLALARDLLALGIRPGGVLLVHSALRALGPQHDPEMVVQALLSVLGEQGTLLMPALSYASVGPSQPVFDARLTPSCVGGLTEYFRTWPGTLRSLHPTHSVSGTGALAAELLAGHEQDSTPCGPHSPFTRLPQVQGQILFLGCGLRPNTSIHAIEEQVEPPYLFGPPYAYRMLRADGSQFSMHVRSHSFKGWTQRYDRLAQVVPTAITSGRVLRAECALVETAVMWPAAIARLREDPLFFVEPHP
jgi:aminoglycoside 3-N-acetyltransferase